MRTAPLPPNPRGSLRIPRCSHPEALNALLPARPEQEGLLPAPAAGALRHRTFLGFIRLAVICNIFHEQAGGTERERYKGRR